MVDRKLYPRSCQEFQLISSGHLCCPPGGNVVVTAFLNPVDSYLLPVTGLDAGVRPHPSCFSRLHRRGVNLQSLKTLPRALAPVRVCFAFQESSNGPVKKSMREKAIERRNINKEHNSNFKAGYVPIEEERLHKTGLRGRKGNMAVCIIVLLFLLALINLIITLVIWTVIRIGPNGCDSMEFHESGLLRFKQKADMGIVHPLHKSTVGGRKDQDLVFVGNNNPVVFQQGTTKLSVEKDKTSVVSDVGISFTDPRTQATFFSTDFENHEFHLPKGVKVLSVKKASTERITSSAASDLNIKGDGKAIIRGNEGVNIMGRTVEFKMGGDIELKAGFVYDII
ncbi:beta-sarcoglycan [Nematolebias whitei]|uniref:beta-sarcoglycan n=1 Tax=Nematolebias whitei TaxID=451745 RepID=UPI0018970C26|nr:beta-sarcoglycan [Nematolebias whitei]